MKWRRVVTELSQAQIVGKPRMKTWDDYEEGCLASFGGGHRADGHLEAFQHGMSTVFNLLRAEFPPAEVCKVAAGLQNIVERLPELVGIVATDCGAINDSRPSLYKRGDVWRYHVQRCGNQWADDADPIMAAEKARQPEV